ncbi:hypothetical protein ACFYW1_35790 [Streptomyces sp. NPDC002669]|uniref:hypothetical protein n=1 Tax=unclassified Streptomyces TaxID=2593676 RepID=UPI0036AC3520
MNRRVLDRSVQIALAGWFTATVLSQHPHRVFDGLRRFDRLGLIPNWRFFAPIPAQHDYVVLHRLVHADRSTGGWQRPSQPYERGWTSVLWSPQRRHVKSVLMVCGKLSGVVASAGVQGITENHLYRILREYVRAEIASYPASERENAVAFQFVVVKSGGYDPGVKPKFIFSSPSVPL